MLLLFPIFQLQYHEVHEDLHSYIFLFILICYCLVSIHNGHSDMMVFQKQSYNDLTVASQFQWKRPRSFVSNHLSYKILKASQVSLLIFHFLIDQKVNVWQAQDVFDLGLRIHFIIVDRVIPALLKCQIYVPQTA